MRVFILENCVVSLDGTSGGSVWFGGEEVWVDEVLGRKMVEEGKAREMQELPTPNPSLKGGGGVEMRVIKAKERAVGKRERRQ